VKRRSTSLAALAVAAVVVAGGCTSNPSAKAVATDIVETLDVLSEAQRTCMLEKLENNYTTDELQAIGEANLDNAPTDEGDADLQRFQNDLNTCMTEG
jgi:hypothetical protein